MSKVTKINMPQDIITTGALLRHGFIALFGAFVHALVAHQNGNAKGVTDVLILTVVSSFSGVIFGLLSFHFLGDSYISLAITGSGGYLGTAGLNSITHALKKSILANLK